MDLLVYRGERERGVDHPQDASAGLAHMAGAVRALRRVFDLPHHRQHPLAALVGKVAGAVAPVELGQGRRLRVTANAAFGALVDRRTYFFRIGGIDDQAILVEDADSLNSRLGAHLVDHVEQGIAVVAQHLVVRAADNQIGDPVGRLFHQVLGKVLLRAQVDDAEEREKGRRAGNHADRQLGGQSHAK